MKNISKKTLRMAQLAILLAVIIIMTVLNIGNIPIGPIVATVYQVPVIIGAVSMGLGCGVALGACWGILCFFLAITGQTTDIVALAVIQQSPLLYFAIAVLPRILTGAVAALVYKGMGKLCKKNGKLLGFGFAGALGSLTNTVFYLGMLYLFIKDLLASLYGIEVGAVGAMILGVAATNGLVEAAVSCVLTVVICKALTMAKIIKGGEQV